VVSPGEMEIGARIPFVGKEKRGSKLVYKGEEE